MTLFDGVAARGAMVESQDLESRCFGLMVDGIKVGRGIDSDDSLVVSSLIWLQQDGFDQSQVGFLRSDLVSHGLW